MNESDENQVYKNHPVSKSVGAKSVLLKSVGAAAPTAPTLNRALYYLQMYRFHYQKTKVICKVKRKQRPLVAGPT